MHFERYPCLFLIAESQLHRTIFDIGEPALVDKYLGGTLPYLTLHCTALVDKYLGGTLPCTALHCTALVDKYLGGTLPCTAIVPEGLRIN